MMKSIGLLPRRPDLSRAAFHDYYETRHAPLAIRHFPFAKYVRNHLLGDEAIGFDTISEFWARDISRLTGLMSTGVGEIMREDERRFMDQPRICSAATEERHLSGPPRVVEVGSVIKEVALLSIAEGVDRQLFAAAAAEWGRTIAAEAGYLIDRMTLDLVQPWPGRPFPYDALLWAWLPDGRPALADKAAPAGITVRATARCESKETLPEALLQDH